MNCHRTVVLIPYEWQAQPELVCTSHHAPQRCQTDSKLQIHAAHGLLSPGKSSSGRWVSKIKQLRNQEQLKSGQVMFTVGAE